MRYSKISRIVHMKEKLKCTFCDHHESQKWRMKQHIRVAHFGERPLYQCGQCDYSADGRRRLDTHRKNAHQKQ